MEVDVYDPWANVAEVKTEYNIQLIQSDDFNHYDAIILAVAHQQFLQIDYAALKAKGSIIFDTKSFIRRDLVDGRL